MILEVHALILVAMRRKPEITMTTQSVAINPVEAMGGILEGDLNHPTQGTILVVEINHGYFAQLRHARLFEPIRVTIFYIRNGRDNRNRLDESGCAFG